MNAYTAGRIAGVRFARDWKQQLDLWTDDKLVGLAENKASWSHTQAPARQRFQQGFVESVKEYKQKVGLLTSNL